MFSPSKKIHREVGRAKDLSAPLYELNGSHFAECIDLRIYGWVANVALILNVWRKPQKPLSLVKIPMEHIPVTEVRCHLDQCSTRIYGKLAIKCNDIWKQNKMEQKLRSNAFSYWAYFNKYNL
jgi:hypothetical protein